MLFRSWAWASEALARKIPSPAYRATRLRTPARISLEVTVQVPATSSVQVPTVVEPSESETLPVGIPLAEATATVTVTNSP